MVNAIPHCTMFNFTFRTLSVPLMIATSASLSHAFPKVDPHRGAMDQIQDILAPAQTFGLCSIKIESESAEEVRVSISSPDESRPEHLRSTVLYLSNDTQTRGADGPRTLSFSREYPARDLESLWDWIWPTLERSTLRLRFDSSNRLVTIQALKHWTPEHNPFEQWKLFDSMNCSQLPE